MTTTVEEHDSSEEAHREQCSFCALAHALDSLFEGHALEEVWEVTSAVLLFSMSARTDDDDEFLRVARQFQRCFGGSVVACLVQRVAERERAEMH